MRPVLVVALVALATRAAAARRTSPCRSSSRRRRRRRASTGGSAYPSATPALVFGVSPFTVTREGWRAEISVENTSSVAWTVGDPRDAAQRQFGVLLFPNDDLDELERRNRDGDVPAIRAATSYSPALPTGLRPGETWKGTIAAPGALAGGLWVRISFGPFASVGDPPPGADTRRLVHRPRVSPRSDRRGAGVGDPRSRLGRRPPP